jgi:hypothetical protein
VIVPFASRLSAQPNLLDSFPTDNQFTTQDIVKSVFHFFFFFFCQSLMFFAEDGTSLTQKCESLGKLSKASALTAIRKSLRR